MFSNDGAEFLKNAGVHGRLSGIVNLSPRGRGPAEQIAPSVHERQTVRDELRENVGIEHHDHAYDGC